MNIDPAIYGTLVKIKNSLPIGARVTFQEGTDPGDSFLPVGTMASRALYPKLDATFPNPAPQASSLLRTLTTTDFETIAYGNGVFVTVSLVGAINYSTDGVSWSPATYPLGGGTAGLRCVRFGNGKFIAIGNGTYLNYIYSTDGITWELGTWPQWSEKQTIAYGGGYWVVGAWDGANTLYSSDGLSWSPVLTPEDNDTNDGRITYNGGTVLTSFYAGGKHFQFQPAGYGVWLAAMSEDGETWYKYYIAGEPNVRGIIYFNDTYFLLESSAGTIRTSTDGKSWTSHQVIPITTATVWNCFGLVNGVLIAFNAQGIGCYATSLDGLNWTIVMDPLLAGISFGNVLVEGNTLYATSLFTADLLVMNVTNNTTPTIEITGQAGQFVKVK